MTNIWREVIFFSNGQGNLTKILSKIKNRVAEGGRGSGPSCGENAVKEEKKDFLY